MSSEPNNRVSTPAVNAVWLPSPWQAIATRVRRPFRVIGSSSGSSLARRGRATAGFPLTERRPGRPSRSAEWEPGPLGTPHRDDVDHGGVPGASCRVARATRSAAMSVEKAVELIGTGDSVQDAVDEALDR